jgi:hypothetical protein
MPKSAFLKGARKKPRWTATKLSFSYISTFEYMYAILVMLHSHDFVEVALFLSANSSSV